MLILLRLVETRYGIQVIGFYIRSRHNKTADLMTREVKSLVDEEARRLGLTEIKGVMKALLDLVDRGFERRALAWEGQDAGQRQVALQVAERRFVRGIPRALGDRQALRGLETFEWRVAWGMYTREWSALGAKTRGTWAPGVTAEERGALRSSGLSIDEGPGGGDLVIWSSSFTQDLSGKEVTYALANVKGNRPRLVVADFPPKAQWKEWVTGLRDLGYLSDAEETLATEHGTPLAVNRVVVHAERTDAWAARPRVAILGALTRQDRPCGVVSVMFGARKDERDDWLPQDKWELQVNPRINTTGEIMLPWPRGKVKNVHSGEAVLVYNPLGPGATPTPKTVGGVTARGGLFLCAGGEGTGVRPLRTSELLGAWGVALHGTEGMARDRTLTLALRSAPRDLVRAVSARTAARVVEGVIAEAHAGKVGMCNHPEEESVRARARQWFLAWRKNPEWPAMAWGIPRREEQGSPSLEPRPAQPSGGTGSWKPSRVGNKVHVSWNGALADVVEYQWEPGQEWARKRELEGDELEPGEEIVRRGPMRGRDMTKGELDILTRLTRLAESVVPRKPESLMGGPVGGLSRVQAMAPETLVRPTGANRGWRLDDSPRRSPCEPITLDLRPIAEAVLDNLTKSIAQSTNKTYYKAWCEWGTFCCPEGKSGNGRGPQRAIPRGGGETPPVLRAPGGYPLAGSRYCQEQADGGETRTCGEWYGGPAGGEESGVAPFPGPQEGQEACPKVSGDGEDAG